MKKRNAALIAAVVVCGMWSPAQAAFDENLNYYTLDTVYVEADATKNKFGDTLTEQAYYSTGGDVKDITREEIEKRHYVDVTDAVKRIPGITFANPGFRGGEYGYSTYSNSISINGDPRVVVLVDGRRVDNVTSTRYGSSAAGGAKTMVDLNQLVSMESIEKIEVIKGPGASAYGADATGGVINIITRKGGRENRGTIDLSTGSWDKHVYKLTYSGSAGDDHSWRYFVTANRNMSGDTKYKDGVTKTNRTYTGTAYKEEGVNFRLDKEIDENRTVKLWYNHQNGHDGYPITARDWRYWNEKDWNRILQGTVEGKFGNEVNPGYRNLFSLDALSGSYNAYRHNDWELSYTFGRENDMESFVRLYHQSHHYWGVDRYPDWGEKEADFVPFPDSKEWPDFIKNYPWTRGLEPNNVRNEKNYGVQVQYGQAIGKHDVLASITYDKASTERDSFNKNANKMIHIESKRDTVQAYVQDKIHVTDNWDLTPALRYSYYNTGKADSADRNGNITTTYNEKVSTLTPAINTQYRFDDTMSAYFGWTKVYRPIRTSDYNTETPNGDRLRDEKGDAWTIGIRKEFTDKLGLSVNYNFTHMSNAIARYSVRLPGEQDFKLKSVNAKEDKKSFNVTADYRLDDHWSFGLAYSYLNDKWKAQPGMEFDPELSLKRNGNVNARINQLRPQNHYIGNITYENGKWYTDLLINWYTGMNTEAFTSRRALVVDWNVNYQVNKDWDAYLSVTNLTNEAYENSYSSRNGLGAMPQPGRQIMVGAKYNF